MLQKVQFRLKTSSAFSVCVLKKEPVKALIFLKPGACIEVRAPALKEICEFSRQNVGGSYSPDFRMGALCFDDVSHKFTTWIFSKYSV